MTVAVSRAKGERRRGGDLRLDREHGGQRRRLRGAGRTARRGDRPRGEDRDRQAGPGADARGPGDRPAGQLRRGAADRPRARRAATRSSSSTRSTPTGSRARRRPRSRSSRSSASRPTRWRSRSATPATSPLGGADSASRARRPVLYGFQAEGAAPLVSRRPVENPETVASAIRIGNPARWEEAMAAFTGSRGRVAAVSDEQILDAYRCSPRSEGVFCEPASAASVAGILAHGLPVARGRAAPRDVVCVLTGHGLKDPDTALGKAPAVIGCEPEIAAVERRVSPRAGRSRSAMTDADMGVRTPRRGIGGRMRRPDRDAAALEVRAPPAPRACSTACPRRRSPCSIRSCGCATPPAPPLDLGGRAAPEAQGDSVLGNVPQAQREPLLNHYRAALRGEMRSFEYRSPTTGREYWGRACRSATRRARVTRALLGRPSTSPSSPPAGDARRDQAGRAGGGHRRDQGARAQRRPDRAPRTAVCEGASKVAGARVAALFEPAPGGTR